MSLSDPPIFHLRSPKLRRISEAGSKVRVTFLDPQEWETRKEVQRYTDSDGYIDPVGKLFKSNVESTGWSRPASCVATMQLEDSPTKHPISHLLEWMQCTTQTGRILYPDLEAALGRQRPLQTLVLTVGSATGFLTPTCFRDTVALHLCHIVVSPTDLDWSLW